MKKIKFYSNQVEIWSKDFFLDANLGTLQFVLGKPTTKSTKGFSLVGLLSILFKKVIGFGVCVSIHKPA